MNKKTLLSISLVILLCVSGMVTFILLNNTATQAGPNFQNPVFEPVIADPSIVRAQDGYFYVYGTEDDWGDGQGARIIPIIRSNDLITWEVVGDAFETKPTWKNAGGLWAPDISFHNDKYYLYYSQSTWGDPNPGIGVATSDSPEGPFIDHGKVFLSDEIGVRNSIDPFYYQDDDGTPYLFWGSFHGIYGIQLSEDGLEPVGEKFEIAGNAFEAPYIIKRAGYYYFFGSLGSCCDGPWSTYRVAVGRADNIQGPYLDKEGHNISFTQGTLILADGDRYVGPGHNAIVTDDNGTDWIVYHAIDNEEAYLLNGATRRPLLIDPIVWEEGWPKIQGLQPGEELQFGPYFKTTN
jgi:arabinan endo-1,5-alpha-L-arabinosidase